MFRFATLAAAAGLFIGVVSAPTASAGPTSVSLARSMPELKLDGVGFGDAIDFLRDVSGANLHVDWKAIEPTGVTRDTSVNVRLRGVTLRKALNMLLTEAGGGDQLAWTVDEGVIEITTKEVVNARMYTRVYAVDDLIMEVPDFTNAPNFDLNSKSGGGGGGSGSGGGGGGGGSLFQENEGEEDKDKGKTKTERGEELVLLVKELISPEIWADNGGTATIRFFNGNLIVRAPRYIHEAIGGSWD